jgi:hypothetical protein
MDYIDKKGAEFIVSSYLENEMLEYRKSNDKEIARYLAPEAKEAFNRKPYGGYTTTESHNMHRVRPVIHAHA